MTRILHLALPEDLRDARASGAFTVSTRGQTLEQVGFIHACTALQLSTVAAMFYRDVPYLTVLVLDVTTLETAGSQVKWEDVPGMPDPFPHIYGPIPMAAVVAEIPARFDEEGRLLRLDLAGLDVA